jgi:hypothetical protein
LLYPRLISFEIDRVDGSARQDGAESAVSHGWLFARPVGAINLKMPQAPAGLIIRKRLFASFLVVQK